MIKAIALDCYGTVLPYSHSPLWDENSENCPKIPPRPRKGIELFFDICEAADVLIFSTSDAPLCKLQQELRLSFRVHLPGRMSISRYGGRFIKMKEREPKDFGEVIERAARLVRPVMLTPRELLVIGDDELADGAGARKIGADYLQVEKYMGNHDDIDFGEIDLRKYGKGARKEYRIIKERLVIAPKSIVLPATFDSSDAE